jgi:hypothetical protein
MLVNDNNFDKSLKARVEDYYMYPDERLWHNIQQKIPNRNRMPNARNYGLMVMLLGFGCFFNVLKHNTEKKPSSVYNYTTNNANLLANSDAKSNNNALTKYKNISSINSPLEMPYNSIGIINAASNDLFAKFTVNTANVLGGNYVNAFDALLTQEKTFDNNHMQNLLTTRADNELLENELFAIHVDEDDAVPTLYNSTAIPNVETLRNSNYTKKEIQRQLHKDTMLPKINLNKQHLSFSTKKEKRWERSMYVVPVMSSVKLLDNGAYGDIGLLKRYNNLSSRFGIEVGAQMHYKINASSITFGIQTNVYGNKFTAYKANEVERAYIVTTSVSSYRLDSVNTILRTVGSSDKSLDLSNKFVTVSFPVGFTQQLFKVSNRVDFCVAGNVAPTILINADNYAVTGNVKNYIKAPEYVRKWNINTSANVYLEYKFNTLRFQVGPQVRHQLLNTYIKGYPIKEKSKDFGLRIGIIKSF